MVAVHGAAGAEWLQRLTAIVAGCAARWSLTVGPPFEPLSYNYVAPAVLADGVQAVLKVGFPWHELKAEVEALRLFDGRGSVRLLEADLDQSAFLLERLEPGTSLAGLANDERATHVLAQTLLQLWRPAPVDHPFPTLSRWTSGLERYRQRFPDGGPLPDDLVGRAIRLRDDLLASTTKVVLLHGDLHHGNILAAQRRPWLAIDPKGVVGDAGYDTGALQYNPVPQLLRMPELHRVMARRIDQLAEELGLAPARVWAWGFVQTVLSACWSSEVEVDRHWEHALACAEILAGLKRDKLELL